MAIKYGTWESPGAFRRSMRLQEARKQGLSLAVQAEGQKATEITAPDRGPSLPSQPRPSYVPPTRPPGRPTGTPTGTPTPTVSPYSRIPASARPTPERRAARQGRVTPDPALGRQRQPGIPSLIEDVFKQVGRVAGGPEEAFLPENAGGLAPRIPRQLVSVENRAATRYAELLEETRQSFPSRTPPGTTVESLALERLDAEMGEELRQPQQEKGLFGKLLSAGLKGTEALVFGRPGGAKEALEAVGKGVEFLETKELGGGGLYRDPGTGKTAFEEGAEISRPVVRAAQPIVAEPFEQVEAAGIPGVSPAAGGVATAIESQIVEDILTEVINPAALVLVAPIALQAASGLRGAAAAAALVSNLLGTGMEPQLIRGTLRGLTLLSRDGLAALPRISKAVRETPVFRQALKALREGEAGGGRLGGGADLRIDDVVTFVDRNGVTRTGKVTQVQRENVFITHDQGKAILPRNAVTRTQAAAGAPPLRGGGKLAGEAGGGAPAGGQLGHADLPKAPAVVDAPQTGFHGTGAKFEAFSEGALDTTALYGPGVYITDDVSIATSYATRRAGQVSGASPTVQTVTTRPGLKLLNMEQPLPDEAINAIERIAQADVSETADALFEGVRVARKGAPGRDVFREIRNELRREELLLSAGDAGEVLESVNLALKESGFDGITHIGGIRGGKPHRVSVLFDPADATVSPAGRIPLGGGPDPRIAAEAAGPVPRGGEPLRLPDELAPTGPPTRPPGRPTGAEAASSFNNAKNKVLKLIRREESLRRRGVVAAEIAAGRGRQVAGIRRGVEAAPTSLEAAQQARAGARVGPLRETVGRLQLSAADEEAFYTRALSQMREGVIGDFDYLRATISLKRALAGEGLQPNQINVLKRVLGEEVGAALARRVRPISEARQLKQAARALVRTLTKIEKTAVRETKKALTTATRARQKAVLGDFRTARDLMRQSIKAANRSDDAIIGEAQELLRLSREALEGVSPRLARLADDQMARLRVDLADKFANADDLVAKAQLLAPDTPEVQAAIRQWTEINDAVMEGVSSEMGSFIASARATITGDLPDSLLTLVGQRSAVLRHVLSRMIPDDPNLVRRIVDNLMESELRRRWGTNVPPKIREMMARTKGAPYQENAGWVQTLVQRVKNTMFSFDLGVFMIQGSTALREGNIPLAAGLVNRMLATMHLPHVAMAYGDAALSKWARYALDGVHQGIGPSAVRANEGSILQYLGRAGKKIDEPLMLVAEKLNEFQFGTVLTGIRNLSYEGNVVMAHLLGQDVSKAAIRYQLAGGANDLGSFAWRALNSTRAGVESTLLISPPMTRAMVNRVLRISKVFRPGATVVERMMGASIIGSWALTILAVGKLLNDRIGVGEFEFNPGKPGFGIINLANGRSINLFPQATLPKAILKSFDTLRTGDTESLKRAWISLGLGRGSIVGQAGGAIFDSGFDPRTGFRIGDLPMKGKILNLLPMPPVLESVALEGFNVYSQGAELLGLSEFPTSPYERRRQEVERIVGKSLDQLEPGERFLLFEGDTQDAAQRFGVTEENIARIREINREGQELSLLRGSPFAETRQDVARAVSGIASETLAPAARGILSGDPLALDAYNDGREEFFTARRAVREAAGLPEFERDPQTKQQALVNDYYAIEPQDLNGNGFIDKEDMDAFFAERDGVLAKMNADSKRAIKDPRNFFKAEELGVSQETIDDILRVEDMRVEAIAAIEAITARPKWDSLTVKESEKVDDLVRQITADVQRFKAQAVREGLDESKVTFRSTAEWLAQQGDITELDAFNAIAVSSGTAIRNQDRIDLALTHRRVLLALYPNFFDSVLPVDVERAELTEEEIGQLEPTGVVR